MDSRIFDGMLAALLFVGAVLGAALVGAAVAMYVWVWPWLKAVIHAVTA